MSNFLKVKDNDARYITGFVHGEGSFNVSFVRRKDYANKIKIVASFNITQKEKNILEWIQSILKCGTIRPRKDGVYYFEVQDQKSLAEIIIPFFDKYELKTKKLNAYKVFKEIVLLISQKYHLTNEGIIKIFRLREKVKVSRKRKLSFSKLLETLGESSETTRQT